MGNRSPLKLGAWTRSTGRVSVFCFYRITCRVATKNVTYRIGESGSTGKLEHDESIGSYDVDVYTITVHE